MPIPDGELGDNVSPVGSKLTSIPEELELRHTLCAHTVAGH
jgi:hypothetical protein